MSAASTPRLMRLAAPATRGVALSSSASLSVLLALSVLSFAGAASASDAPAAPAAAAPAAMPAPVSAPAAAPEPARPRAYPPVPPPAAAPAPVAHAGAAPAGHPPSTYMPQRGESLDAVIKKTIGDSPLRIELLRQAFVQSNTHAFPSGKAGRLPPGIVLHVPDHTQLVRAALIPMLLPGEAYLGGTVSASPEERRRWVRFP